MGLRDNLLRGSGKRRIKQFDLTYQGADGLVTEKTHVRSLLASELGEIHYQQTLEKNEHFGRCIWVAACLCDGVGNLVFQKTDVRVIADLDAFVVTTIYNEALAINSSLTSVEKKDDGSGCVTVPSAD